MASRLIFPRRFIRIWRFVKSPAIIITLLTLGWFWPLWGHFWTQAWGLPGDPSGAIWSFDHSTQVPLHFTLTQPVLLALEGWGLTKVIGAVAAYNFLSVAAFWLTAWWGFRFLRALLPVGPALFAALVITWSPYHILQSMQHLGIASTQYLMLFGLALVALWRAPSYRAAALMGGAFALVELHDYYLGLVAAVVAIVYVCALVGTKRLAGVRYALTAAGVVVVAILPFLWRIVEGLVASGKVPTDLGLPIRDKVEVAVYSLRLSNFLTPPIDHPFLGIPATGQALGQLHGSNLFEQTFWLGFVGLIVGAIAIVLKLHKRFKMARVVGLSLVGLGIIFGVSSLSSQVNEPSLFGALIYHWAPVFRVWARFGILIVIGVALLIGVGFAAFNPRVLAQRIAIVIVGGLIVAEMLTIPPQRTFGVGTKATPRELIQLAQQSPGAAVALYPLAPSGEVRDSIYRTWTQFANFRLWNAQSEWVTQQQATSTLTDPFDPTTVARLQAQGVSYIVFDLEAYAEGAVPPAVLRYYDPEFPNHPPEYNLPSAAIPANLQEVLQLEDGRLRIFKISK